MVGIPLHWEGVEKVTGLFTLAFSFALDSVQGARVLSLGETMEAMERPSSILGEDLPVWLFYNNPHPCQ